MGEVYRARDTRLERTVAIKVLASFLCAEPEAKERFEREAKIISSLNHPHICQLYDVGEQNEINFLVMDYLEGETLAQRLQKGPSALQHRGLTEFHSVRVSYRGLESSVRAIIAPELHAAARCDDFEVDCGIV